MNYNESIPYVLTISNKSDKIKTVNLFSMNEKQDKDLEIKINSSRYCSYESLKLELLVSPISVKIIHLFSKNMVQLFKDIEVISYKNNGVTTTENIKPRLDPMQNQSCVTIVRTNLILNSFTMMNFELLPNTEIIFSFYYDKQVHLSEALKDKEIILSKKQKRKLKFKNFKQKIKAFFLKFKNKLKKNKIKWIKN